jgi:hypothetical protein
MKAIDSFLWFGNGDVVKLTTFETMDPHLLVGLVNTELRNNASSLKDLCKTHGLEEKVLVARLADADYHFVEDQKTFR